MCSLLLEILQQMQQVKLNWNAIFQPQCDNKKFCWFSMGWVLRLYFVWSRITVETISTFSSLSYESIKIACVIIKQQWLLGCLNIYSVRLADLNHWIVFKMYLFFFEYLDFKVSKRISCRKNVSKNSSFEIKFYRHFRFVYCSINYEHNIILLLSLTFYNSSSTYLSLMTHKFGFELV